MFSTLNKYWFSSNVDFLNKSAVLIGPYRSVMNMEHSAILIGSYRGPEQTQLKTETEHFSSWRIWFLTNDTEIAALQSSCIFSIVYFPLVQWFTSYLVTAARKAESSSGIWQETNGAFPPEGAGWFSLQRCGMGLPPYSSRSTQVWTTHTICWLVNRICTSVRQGENNKPPQYPQGISGQWRKLGLMKKMSKSLMSFLDVLRCCSLFIVRVLLFHWIY